MNAATVVWPLVSPKRDPKSTLTPELPLLPPRVALAPPVVQMVRKNTPRPRIQANTLPITTSSARPARPRTAMATPNMMHAPNRPMRRSIPAAKAARAPVKGHVGEGVSGEDLGAQDHEVADESGGGDDRADVGPDLERQGQHVADPDYRVAASEHTR